MSNHFIKTTSYGVQFNEITDTEPSVEKHGQGIRIYRTSPYCVSLQIRATTPLENSRSRSKKKARKLYAHIELNVDQIDGVIAALMAESENLRTNSGEAERQLQVQAVLTGRA